MGLTMPARGSGAGEGGDGPAGPAGPLAIRYSSCLSAFPDGDHVTYFFTIANLPDTSAVEWSWSEAYVAAGGPNHPVLALMLTGSAEGTLDASVDGVALPTLDLTSLVESCEVYVADP